MYIWIKHFLRKIWIAIKHDKKPKFKHGKCFYSNSLIDTLFPKLVEIGDNFTSAPGSIILAHDASLVRLTGKYRAQKTKIGNNVFLGANSVVLPGITIGNNVIVGAGSIVTKNIPSNSIVCGNPATIISTPYEYKEKCQKKGILYSANNDFLDKINRGVQYTAKDLDSLRDYIYRQIEESNDK